MSPTAPRDRPRVLRSPRRLLLALLGVVCVGLAAVGVVVPGFPTTVFLIVASYLFTRSCPWLEERLIRNRFFGPFVQYLDSSTRMPARAKFVAIGLMWGFVALSVWLLVNRFGPDHWVPFAPPLAAVLGTWFIARHGAGRGPREGGAAHPKPR